MIQNQKRHVLIVFIKLYNIRVVPFVSIHVGLHWQQYKSFEFCMSKIHVLLYTDTWLVGEVFTTAASMYVLLIYKASVMDHKHQNHGKNKYWCF